MADIPPAVPRAPGPRDVRVPPFGVYALPR
jgi:hypothetical protein